MSLSLCKEVDVLREKIKDSEVKVEVDSQNSNLAEVVNKIRNQYDKLAKKNLKETEEWYQSKARVTPEDHAQVFSVSGSCVNLLLLPL